LTQLLQCPINQIVTALGQLGPDPAASMTAGGTDCLQTPSPTAGHTQLTILPRHTAERVRQTYRHHQSLDLVKAIVPSPQDLQKQVYFGGCSNLDQRITVTNLHAQRW
jgi:hypothetical protein